jgi:hypothetical protein
MEKKRLMAHVNHFLINSPVAFPAAIIILKQTGIPIASAPMPHQTRFPGGGRG